MCSYHGYIGLSAKSDTAKSFEDDLMMSFFEVYYSIKSQSLKIITSYDVFENFIINNFCVSKVIVSKRFY